MAGTLVISTLSDGTNSTSSTNCIQGSAKAWVQYQQNSPATIRASYNVSSITYSSGSLCYVNFTNALADANYSVISSGGISAGSYNYSGSVPISSSQCAINTTGYNTYQSVAIFR